MTSIVEVSRAGMMNVGNDWREDASSVKDKLKYILMNDNTKQDVVIVVGCGSTETKIKAHSFMLFIGSQTLERLLEQAKMNNEGMKEIKLPDISPEAMIFVLKYIYTECTELENEDAIDILYASLKLNLRCLAALCVTKLKDEITSANVLRIFEVSVKMNVEELVKKSQEFILRNAREVFHNEQFKSITNESLCKLLTFDELQMDEISIFVCIISWAKAECVRSELEQTSENLRFVLKKVVPLIRFTLMPADQFATIVVPTNLLNDHEVIDVYNYLGIKSSNASKQAELPLWISSSSERLINQAENDGNAQEQIKPNNTRKGKLLQYLMDVSGEKTFSGLFFNSIDTVGKGVQTMHRITSVHPAIITVEMPGCLSEVDLWQSFTKELITNWNNGYLVHIFWGSSRHPFELLGIFKTLDDNKWNDLLKDDGHLNGVWKTQLDAIAPYFQELQDAGVVVICDILPWINNKEHSWGGRAGTNGSLKLYQITHDYMTQNHNLHCLLWTWSHYYIGKEIKMEEFWPGNEYVDVASIYMYDKKQVELILYQKLLEVVGDKPISMEKVYTVPSPEILVLQPRWTWFTTAQGYLENTLYNNNENMKTTFQGVSIINKENNEFFKTSNSN